MRQVTGAVAAAGTILVAAAAAAAVSGVASNKAAKQASAAGVTVVPAAAATSTATAGTSTTGAVTGSATAAGSTSNVALATSTSSTKLGRLAPLDLSDMRLWNWNGKWIGSEWSNSYGAVGWKFDHIIAADNGNVRFRLDASGAPQIQAGYGQVAHTDGLWETEVTLPTMRAGLIVAPLWLYDNTSRDEIDFEFAGRNGLTVSMHGSVNGQAKSVTVPVLAGRDLSGERHRFGIRVDQTAGFVDMLVDGTSVFRWYKSNTPFFVTHAMQPWIHLLPTDPKNAGLVAWTGRWAGMTKKDSEVMVVHGYGYTPKS